MITRQLLKPNSIVIVGASDNIEKPGGKILFNILSGQYYGKLYAVNPKKNKIQGIKSYNSVSDLPHCDLAIIATAAKFIPEIVKTLAYQKQTKAFIIISAGFSEESEVGLQLEKQIVNTINSINGSLIGPNCTGILTPHYNGIFTLPIPKLDTKGCDLISGSGATACFIMEAGIPVGLKFSNVLSVGNSAQMGIEEILQHMDEHFDLNVDSNIKLLYIENITDPVKLLKHTSSLIQKGCKIAAVKAGTSEAGSRAASSHTGALASPDTAVDALFNKAGIVRCYGRNDLISVASVFMNNELKGRNIAIITHAGGPAVMLTDALSLGGFNVPTFSSNKAKELLKQLFSGSSVANPVDFLATGTADQLGIIIDYIDLTFKDIDGIVVIFGTPGLKDIYDVYDVLDKKIKGCSKPIFSVLPSGVTAKLETENFISKGHIIFPDEVILGQALSKVYNCPTPSKFEPNSLHVNRKKIREIIDNASPGYLSTIQIHGLLDAACIPRVKEFVVKNISDAEKTADKIGYPLVMKVIGPVHKSDVGGVYLNINNKEKVISVFNELINIKDASAVSIQTMLKGTELFIGAKKEDKFGHLILCGLGGIFIEILKDTSTALHPINSAEASSMIKNLQAYKIIQGTRGQTGINENLFIEVICKLSALIQNAPEITELDINPLIATPETITAVDCRIKIEF